MRLVYVREAHPSDGWQVPQNETQGVIVRTPRSLTERNEVADTCAAKLKLDFPVVVDGIDDAVEKAYAGWPDRIYVIDKTGKIVYKGAPGPAGFKPREAEQALIALLEPTKPI